MTTTSPKGPADQRQLPATLESTQTVAPYIPGYGDTATHSASNALDLRDLLQVVKRRWPWIAATILLVLVIGIAMTATQEKRYAATSSLELRAKSAEFYTNENLAKVIAELQQGSITSPEALIRLANSGDVQEEALKHLEESEQRAVLYATVEQTQEKENILAVKVTARTPAAAADMANALVVVLKERDLKLNTDATSKALKYVETEMNRIGVELDTKRQALAKFRVTYHPNGENEVLGPLLDQLASLRRDAAIAAEKLQVARNDEQKLGGEIDKLRDAGQVQVPKDSAEDRNPVYDQIQALLTTRKMERADLATKYQPDAPAVKRLDTQISELEEELRRTPPTRATVKQWETNPDFRQLSEAMRNAKIEAFTEQHRYDALMSQIDTLNAQLDKLPPVQEAGAQIATQVKTLGATYDTLSQSYQNLRITEASKVTNLAELGRALPNPRPVSPNIPRGVVLSLVLGILLSIAITAVLESMDNRIHSQQALERVTHRMPLAQIPRMNRASLQLLDNAQGGPVLEQMRMLRSNLTLNSIGEDGRVVAITSPGVGEGKSTMSLNLAVAMALDGKRVVLIDADLRRPSLHGYLNVRNDIGLSSIVHGTATLAEALVNLSVEGVKFLPAGPAVANPPETLNLPQTRDLLGLLRESYDAVIIDTPPAAGLSDVLNLAPCVDGFVVVVSNAQTSRDNLSLALGALEQIGAKILGFIYNRADVSRGYYSRYNYYSR